MIAVHWKRARIEIVSILAPMAIHAIVQPNVEWKITELCVHVQPAMLAIHSSTVSLSQSCRNPNVSATVNAPQRWPALIKRARIHVLNAIHAQTMLNAM